MNSTNHSIHSVEENLFLFTDGQFQRSKHARQVYHALGTPSLYDFMATIMSNQIKDLLITFEDINIAEKIFGADIGAFKGKSTRRKPAAVFSDYIEITGELFDKHHYVILCMDGIWINCLHFLTTVSRSILYHTAEFVPTQTTSAYRSALDNL
jgi:hypothetical protein